MVCCLSVGPCLRCAVLAYIYGLIAVALLLMVGFAQAWPRQKIVPYHHFQRCSGSKLSIVVLTHIAAGMIADVFAQYGLVSSLCVQHPVCVLELKTAVEQQENANFHICQLEHLHVMIVRWHATIGRGSSACRSTA
eukprot:3084638-Amphidinium_carterae.1